MVLVTGGTGLLGAHLLLHLLKSGEKVRALKRPNSNTLQVLKTFGYYTLDAQELFSQINWVDGNVNDIYTLLEAMDGVNEVYHCAALVSFNPKDDDAILKVNIEGTENMVNAALEKGVKKFCHVSSIAAFGKVDGIATEESHWKSTPENGIYSISKYAAEREVWRAAQEGLEVVVVNPSVIIGPGDWRTSSTNMVTRAYKGLKFYTEGSTGFVDVRDVASIMLQLMKSNINGERFIVSSENIGFKQFFEDACDFLKKPKPIIKVGSIVSSLVWRLEKIKSSVTGIAPLITKNTARAAHQKKQYDNEKVRLALGYNFIPVKESICNTCKHFLKEQEAMG